MNTFSIRKDFRVIRQPWLNHQLEIRLAQITTDNNGTRVEVAKPIVMEAVPMDQPVALPVFMALEGFEAQQLMDELWNAGIRPTEGTGSAGQLAAVQAHLDDFRKIAFQALNFSRE